MSECIALQPGADWVELRTTEEDWAGAAPGLLGTMLTHMHLIRGFEEAVLELAAEGLVHGPAHSSIGQEGGAAGSIVGLTGADQVNGSHRGHHQFLSKALGYLAPQGLDPDAPFTAGVQTLLPMMLDHVSAGRLSLPRLADLMGTGPARVYGALNKGRLAVGYDGDVTVVDMKRTRTIEDSWIASPCGWTPFAGHRCFGWPVMTVIRGHVAMRENEVLGTPQGRPVLLDVLPPLLATLRERGLQTVPLRPERL